MRRRVSEQAPAPPVYVVKLQPSPGWSPYSEPRRLARALKALGRAYGFRCTACVREKPVSEERAA